MENYFTKLNSINVNEKTEKKNGLTYLSWAWAWGEVKKLYPNASYTIYERTTEYGPVNYFTDGRTCWVKTGVLIEGIEHIEELPIMDYRNRSIALEQVTSFDVNKSIQRSLTKAVARHGLGLYIYAGEDLPEDEQQDVATTNVAQNGSKQATKQNKTAQQVGEEKVDLAKQEMRVRMLNSLTDKELSWLIKKFNYNDGNQITLENLEWYFKFKEENQKGAK